MIAPAAIADPRTLVVTGGARGIGAAIARHAAAAAYQVCIADGPSFHEAERLASAIRDSGGHAIAEAADVADEQDVERLFRSIDAKLGRLHALVNNAGIIGKQCRVADVSASFVSHVLAVNVVGAFLCSREAVRRMSTARHGGGGAIVNISSAATRHGGIPEEVHYAASKGAIDVFTMSLAKEVGPEGIRVNAIRPGFIATGIHEVHGGDAAAAAVAPTVPLRRIGTADEVAAAVLWLLSDEASYVTGALLDVGGGR